MSRLKTVATRSLDDLLAAAPGALDADNKMRNQIHAGLSPRLYALIGVTVAGLLGCERFAEALRGPLDQTKTTLGVQEKAVLAYVEKGTLDEAAVRRSDVDALRAAGFSDRDVLTVATAVAYHNYAIRLAVAFDVLPR